VKKMGKLFHVVSSFMLVCLMQYYFQWKLLGVSFSLVQFVHGFEKVMRVSSLVPPSSIELVSGAKNRPSWTHLSGFQ